MQTLISPDIGLIIWTVLNAALIIFIVALIIKYLRKKYKAKKTDVY